VDALLARVELLESRARPGAAELVIEGDVTKIRQQFKLASELGVLSADFLSTIRARAEQTFRDETKALDEEIGPAIAPLRAAIGERLAVARRVPLESERVSVDAPNYVQAKLLDTIASKDAREWLDAHAHDLSAIESRYLASDDRRDCAFVQLCEAQFGLTSEAPEAESSVVPMPLRRQVRARQDQRIPQTVKDAIVKLDAAESRYTQARASAFPSTATATAAIGELIRRGK
jgi:hypothetical protein